jgi:hypothetical protein
MRRLLSWLLVAGAALGGAIVFRRRFSRRRERVDLYYEDGSMTSAGEGSADGERLLPIARRALQAAQ